MDKILFILNPVAGGGSASKLELIINEEMNLKNIDYEIKLTNGPKDATKLAQKGIAEGYKLIVSIGGDGTINEIAQAIVGKDIALGIIPGGSGNDLARSLGIPFNTKDALNNILNNEIKKLDVGYVNGKSFLNISSAGLDSAVVVDAKKFKKRFKGNMAYTISLLINLIKFKKKKIRITIGEDIFDEDIYLIAVGNGKTYGGGFNVLPMAEFDDGYFHICIVKKAIKPILLIIFPSILFAKHTFFKKYVSIYKSKEVKIETDEKLYLNIDGEIEDLPRETYFNIESNNLNIIY